MLWGALAPTLAQAAVAGSGSQGWVEVCSTTGVVWVQLDGPAEPAGTDHAPGLMDASSCAWCLLQGAGNLPPVHAATSLTTNEPGARPGWNFSSILPCAVWSTAQSRAPPLA